MQKVFTSHFLELNWKPLKTECVLHLLGHPVPTDTELWREQKMLDGLLPRPSAAVIAAADEHDRAAGLTKCTRARFLT